MNSEINRQQQRDNGHIRSATVHLTERCNLACTYCFSSHYRHGGTMTPECARSFADWMIDQSKKGEYNITFFGGEPLLETDLMKVIIDRIAEKKKEGTTFKYSATSNGTLISPRIKDFLKENRISIMVSTDGDQATHDRYRVHENGAGSFQEFLAGLDVLRDIQPRITARLTFTPETVGELTKNHEALFLKYGVHTVAASPVVEAEWDESSLDEYDVQLYNLSGLMLEHWAKGRYLGVRLIEKEIEKLVDNNDKRENRYPCGAGRLSAGVGIDGKIYPCHRFVGMDDFLVGTIYNGIDTGKRLPFWTPPLEDFTTCRADGCKNCDLRTLCAGECYQVCLETTGDIKKAPSVHYELKHRTVNAAGKMMNYLLHSEPRLLERIVGLEKNALDCL